MLDEEVFNPVKKEIVKVLQDLVRIPSVNPPGLELAMGDYIYKYMTEAGIETEKVFVEPNRYNIVSTLPGKNREKGIIFTGHMDVVPVSDDEKQRWNTDPFGANIIGEYLYGRGSSDMKGGLCCAMVAMKTLKEQNILPDQDIVLVATVDEEDLMKGSKAMRGSDLLKHCRSVVVCEPTDLEVCTSSNGRTYGYIHVRGKTGHGSRPGVGQNAIELSRFIMDHMAEEDFKEFEHKDYGRSFWQPLAIHAGVDPCVVPDKCSMEIDARIVPDHTPDDVWVAIKKIFTEIQKDIPAFKADIELIDERESWETSPETEIIRRTKEAFQQLQLHYEDSHFTGTTDGTILRRDHRDVVILGPGSLDVVHHENEKVRVADLYKAFELYLQIMTLEEF